MRRHEIPRRLALRQGGYACGCLGGGAATNTLRRLLQCLPLALAGCSAFSNLHPAPTTAYEPANVHRGEPSLPERIKRVAFLPVTSLGEDFQMEFGRDTLGPLLADELGRARLFELVLVSPDELRALTGRPAWSGEEQLPLDFFERLQEKLGVDAVLFTRLTQYRAYQPLNVGWRLKLIDADEPRVIWAVDEVFDAGAPSVALAARRYAAKHSGTASGAEDILVSPRRFGRYTANAVFSTLPGRRTVRESENPATATP